jgi:hypothetical protein
MGLFWKRSKNKGLTAVQERFADKIGMGIIRRQTKIAAYLNRKTQYWNKSSKLIALALFTLLFGGLCLFLLLTNLFR